MFFAVERDCRSVVEYFAILRQGEKDFVVYGDVMVLESLRSRLDEFDSA